MSSLRVSNVFVTKFELALARMTRNSMGAPDSYYSPGVPRKLAIEEFLEEMEGDLLDALVGENLRRFLLKPPSETLVLRQE